MQIRPSLSRFIRQVQIACLTALQHERFCEDQKQLLRDTVDAFFRTAPRSDWGQPLGLFYCVYRICGEEHDEVALALARFSAFYVMAADLFDDVQDEDLDGKPHEQAGASVATNSALTLLTLALDALGYASILERRSDRALKYLRVFNRVSLIAVAAQHRDLMGSDGARTTKEVEALHRGKTSSLALLCECAALAGGADERRAKQFYALGEDLCAAVQVIDDVRDLVVRDESIDLSTGKWTYPLACFYEAAQPAERRRLENLLTQRPLCLDSIRGLLEESGSFNQCAAAVEAHRCRILDRLETPEFDSPHSRILCEIVDHLAAALYDPLPRPRSDSSHPPTGITPRVDASLPGAATMQPTHCLAVPPVCSQRVRVAHAAREFERHMAPYGFDAHPELLPWHLPIYQYVPRKERIYFSDTDGLPEETVPFHAEMLQLSLAETLDLMRQCEPFLVAHELVHAWRDRLGRLGHHAWHEEYVANEVAFAYSRRYYPERVEALLFTSRRILAQGRSTATSYDADQLIRAASKENGPPQDYGLDPGDAARVHARMIVGFAATPLCLEGVVEKWLRLPGLAAAE